jgi:predicted membrane protein
MYIYIYIYINMYYIYIYIYIYIYVYIKHGREAAKVLQRMRPEASRQVAAPDETSNVFISQTMQTMTSSCRSGRDKQRVP